MTPKNLVHPQSDVELLDYQLLMERCLGNAALAQRVLTRYLESGTQDCQQLLAAQRAGDRRTLTGLAHRIKGSAATVGSSPIAELAGSLEQQAETLDESALLAIVQEIGSLHAEVSERCMQFATTGAAVMPTGAQP